jgi:hypothetical protein
VDKIRTRISQERAGILADRVGWNVFKESNNVALIVTSFRVVKLQFQKEKSSLVSVKAVTGNV